MLQLQIGLPGPSPFPQCGLTCRKEIDCCFRSFKNSSPRVRAKCDATCERVLPSGLLNSDWSQFLNSHLIQDTLLLCLSVTVWTDGLSKKSPKVKKKVAKKYQVSLYLTLKVMFLWAVNRLVKDLFAAKVSQSHNLLNILVLNKSWARGG